MDAGGRQEINMVRGLSIGLVIGVLLGGVLGAFLAGRDQEPAPMKPAPTVGPGEPTQTLEPVSEQPEAASAPEADSAALEAARAELEKAQGRIDTLSAELADARKQLASIPAEPTVEEPALEAKPDVAALQAEFDALAKKGFAALQTPEFQALVEKLKDAGAVGLKILTDTLAEDESGEARFIAAMLLERAADPSTVPALTKALQNDEDLIVRRACSRGLATMVNEKALEPLRTAMMGDTDWGVRVNAAYGVAKLGGADGLKILEDAYFSEETPDEYAVPILGGLADVADPSTAPTFRKILQDTEDPTYLLLSMRALAKMKDTGAISLLQQMVQSDLPQSVRQSAQQTIEAIQVPDEN